MLLYAFIISAITTFIHACTREKMVIYVVNRSTKKAPDFLRKPLFECPTCMSMWWGPSIIAYGIIRLGWEFQNIDEVFVTCILSGGMNYMIQQLTGAINEKCNCGTDDRRKKRINDLIQKFETQN